MLEIGKVGAGTSNSFPAHVRAREKGVQVIQGRLALLA
jgi:hypothetical protein